jgi:hypothetical protein
VHVLLDAQRSKIKEEESSGPVTDHLERDAAAIQNQSTLDRRPPTGVALTGSAGRGQTSGMLTRMPPRSLLVSAWCLFSLSACSDRSHGDGPSVAGASGANAAAGSGAGANSSGASGAFTAGNAALGGEASGVGGVGGGAGFSGNASGGTGNAAGDANTASGASGIGGAGGGGGAGGMAGAAGAGGVTMCSECNRVTSYCQETIGGVPGSLPRYACLALPNGCGATASCQCLTSVPCGSLCSGTAATGLKTTCLAP